MTWEEIRAEAEHVLSMQADDQYLGGQELAEMVLEYQPNETAASWQQTAAAIISDDPNALRERLAELQGRLVEDES